MTCGEPRRTIRVGRERPAVSLSNRPVVSEVESKLDRLDLPTAGLLTAGRRRINSAGACPDFDEFDSTDFDEFDSTDFDEFPSV